MPYRSNNVSIEMKARLCASACAMSILSNGSRWGPGSDPARMASSTVIGKSSKPSPAMAPGMSSASASAPDSLPIRRLVVISQADAALTSFSFDSFPMARRAATGNRSFPASHHMKAWVSRRRRNDQPSQADNSSSGSGSKKLSSSAIRSFHEPNCGFPWR